MVAFKRKVFLSFLMMGGLTVLFVSGYITLKIGLSPLYSGFKVPGYMHTPKTSSKAKNHQKAIKLPGLNRTIKTVTPRAQVPFKRSRLQNILEDIINVNGGTQARRSLTLGLACERLQKDYPRRLPGEHLPANLVYTSKKNGVLLCDYMRGDIGNSSQLCDIINAVTHTSDSNFRMTKQSYTTEFQSLKNVSCVDGHKILRDSVKLLFVREPYSRLLYAYLQTYFITYRGHTENSDHVNNGTSAESGEQCPPGLSFTQFLQIFLDKHKVSPGNVFLKNGQLQTMWHSAYQSCSPCDITYDYIGKLDKLSFELNYMFTASNIKSFFNFKETVEKWERELVESLVSSVMESSLKSCVPLRASLDRVWKALQMMGIVSFKVPLQLNDSERQQDIKKKFLEQIVVTRNNTAVNSQTKQNLVVKAYRLVPKHILEQLKTVLLPEFKLFGYDPDLVFNPD